MRINITNITSVKVEVFDDACGFRAEITENGEKIAPDVFYPSLGFCLIQHDNEGNTINGGMSMLGNERINNKEEMKNLVIENIGIEVGNIIHRCNLSKEFLEAPMEF